MKVRKLDKHTIELEDTDGNTWILTLDDRNFPELARKYDLGQRVFAIEEIYHEIAIASANDKLEEARILEEAWWATGDIGFQHLFLQLLNTDYKLLLSRVGTHLISTLADKIEEEILTTEDWERKGKLLAQQAPVLNILAERGVDRA